VRILLVEPDYRRGAASFIKTVTAPDSKKREDESLWYPPISLLKLATFHKRRGDEVKFVIGRDKSAIKEADLFSCELLWDRIYITTLFTFTWKNVIETINFYKKAVGGSIHKIFVGGIMASIIPNDIFEETGIQPVVGLLNSPQKIGLPGDEGIDSLPPDYSILDNRIYAINDTYYAYTTRGCTKNCPWCGVSDIEPRYCEYINIKPMIREMRELWGDKSRLKLMDNNVLASPSLERIISDLVELGYGRGQTTQTLPPRTRVIDFNQGLEATHINEDKISLIEKLHIKPMRIAFDRLGYKDTYVNAVNVAHKHGFKEFSNYMLYNEKDSPRDLYDRLIINVEMNRYWRDENGKSSAAIYSYPMRFAPIKDDSQEKRNRSRDYVPPKPSRDIDYLNDAQWTKRFTRNIEIIKGAAHGAISPTPSLALRAIGETYEEFITNLYMPEELLRNRDKYEARIYPNKPDRKPGTGDIEKFREFIMRLLSKQDKAFFEFHEAVSPCTKEATRKAFKTCSNKEVREWLMWYLK
jgi:hypothetical protein